MGHGGQNRFPPPCSVTVTSTETARYTSSRRIEMTIRNLFVAIAGTMTLMSAVPTPASADSAPLPVLMVIANRDFYYKEYADTRTSLESEGMRVVVAAATTQRAIPH